MKNPDTDLLTVTELKQFIKETLLENRTLKTENDELMRKNQELLTLLPTLSALNGFISICSDCKCIRDSDEKQPPVWIALESFFAKYTGVRFTHGICPRCARTLYPDFNVSKTI
ncbi:hypothetical protein QUF90_16430 [Desulfococcaceae bacterium HSG9]|nr:hypothetical protein [Desulfococcaceae bacterium HSG9]